MPCQSGSNRVAIGDGLIQLISVINRLSLSRSLLIFTNSAEPRTNPLFFFYIARPNQG